MADPRENEVDQFLISYVDSVPQLEALLLLWNSRPQSWTLEEMAHRLFLAPESTREILDGLVRIDLAGAAAPDVWRYESRVHEDRLLALVDLAYRGELIRISRLIHAKAPSSVRAFARAFRFKKDRP